jgi:hypothetical protein
MPSSAVPEAYASAEQDRDHHDMHVVDEPQPSSEMEKLWTRVRDMAGAPSVPGRSGFVGGAETELALRIRVIADQALQLADQQVTTT